MTSQKKVFQPYVDDRSMNVNAVKIVNLPNHVNRREIIALFNKLIGDVRSTSEFRDAIGTHMEIVFSSRDAAKKALCMSGYTIGGCSLVVTPVESVEDRVPKRPDERRNLYVLGIPFDLTKNEFAAVFSRYGTVTHCVVLATVDNVSRRRGFVVMSTHEEAKRAMMALTRTQIKGHTIDISWSIVQRSQGFLDGGDRTNVFDPYGNFSSDNPQDDTSNPISPDIHSTPSETSFTLVFIPSTTLLVTNLPFILFSQTSDLEPLLCPFGEIKKLEMISLPSPQETTSVLAEYTDISSAQEAKESLQGQCYVNYRINAEYASLTAAMTQLNATPGFNINDYDGKYHCRDHVGFAQRACSTAPDPFRCFHSVLGGQTAPAKRPLQDISNSSYHISQALQYATPHTIPTFPTKRPISRTGSASSKWSVESSRCPSRNHNQNQLCSHSNQSHLKYGQTKGRACATHN
ncbi:hypothetical protein E1B28_006122 [Marasmius oreades]|uniref:RRM domain-containing protein n=1 Tax=Marasmius oreades TaxID=181124 RepID=A0A9P7S533_9AGAR|nr:uncharacterized protein E1B28_006122 [Marasmius oreades]KAG7095363.1 hypothetical protein E1B28_006122 [Marasmius oreades]